MDKGVARWTREGSGRRREPCNHLRRMRANMEGGKATRPDKDRLATTLAQHASTRKAARQHGPQNAPPQKAAKQHAPTRTGPCADRTGTHQHGLKAKLGDTPWHGLRGRITQHAPACKAGEVTRITTTRHACANTNTQWPEHARTDTEHPCIKLS